MRIFFTAMTVIPPVSFPFLGLSPEIFRHYLLRHSFSGSTVSSDDMCDKNFYEGAKSLTFCPVSRGRSFL